MRSKSVILETSLRACDMSHGENGNLFWSRGLREKFLVDTVY